MTINFIFMVRREGREKERDAISLFSARLTSRQMLSMNGFNRIIFFVRSRRVLVKRNLFAIIECPHENKLKVNIRSRRK